MHSDRVRARARDDANASGVVVDGNSSDGKQFAWKRIVLKRVPEISCCVVFARV